MSTERRLATLGAHFATLSLPLPEGKAALDALAALLDHDNHDMRQAAKELCRDAVRPASPSFSEAGGRVATSPKPGTFLSE